MEATRDLKPRREECCHLANTTDLTIVHPGFLPHLPIHNFFPTERIPAWNQICSNDWIATDFDQHRRHSAYLPFGHGLPAHSASHGAARTVARDPVQQMQATLLRQDDGYDRHSASKYLYCIHTTGCILSMQASLLSCIHRVSKNVYSNFLSKFPLNLMISLAQRRPRR